MRVVATAGHVDHGKSTLLRALTGMEPDRWEEERERGLTIDLGFVWTTLDGPGGAVTVAFVDVPGHRRFVPNMLAGAGAIDLCMLVIAADDGWSAQTTEHVAILDLLEVRGVVTVITKTSLVSDARVLAVQAEVDGRLAGTSLDAAPVVAVDSLTGQGIEALAQELSARLADIPPADEAVSGRLWVDRVFTIPGAGTVVTGTLQGCALTVGHDVQHAPSGRSLRIRGLHAVGHPVDRAEAGTRVAVNLARVPIDELERGDALTVGDWLVTSSIDVMLRSVADEPIQQRGAWHLHIGAAEVPVRLRPLLDRIEPGQQGLARLELARPLALRHGDRFVLRSAGTQTTVAGGRVLDAQPAPRAKGMLARLELAERLDALHHAETSQARLEALLDLHDGHLPEQQARAGLGSHAPVDGPAAMAKLDRDLVLDETLDGWEHAALEAVRAAGPARGASVTDVATTLGQRGCPESLRRAVIEGLREAGRLHAHGDVLTAPEDTRAYLDARARRQAAVLESMARDSLAPPDLDHVTRRLQVGGTELQGLFHDGRLVHLGEVVVTGTAIDLAHRLLRDAFADRGFTASEAREVWQTTRKYAVPLLEHLARTGNTTFDGVHHHLAPAADDPTALADMIRATDA